MSAHHTPASTADLVPVRRAILSLSDKTGLIELATALAGKGVALLASGGTYKSLADAGFEVTEISAYTGQPEILGGRVKTLHPKIHGGILARRELADDMSVLAESGFEPIDLVVVNLYPFEQTVAKPGVTWEEAIEQIDIGGPSLVRGAAKNHSHVAVLTSPDQYAAFLAEFAETGGTRIATRKRLMLEAIRRTSRYDAMISAWVEKQLATSPEPAPAAAFPPSWTPDRPLKLKSTLRYGENPHQKAAWYVEPDTAGPNLATAKILHGKELSYNNLLDLDSALRLVRNFAGPGACVLKHNNPCGAAIAADISTAFERAYEGDPVSAFGGIVGTNRVVDAATAERMAVPGRFLECVIAPGFTPEALQILTTKPTWKNSVRLVSLEAELKPGTGLPEGYDWRRVEGGVLLQDWDAVEADDSAWKVATDRPPTESESRDLAFAWVVCQAVKSNAIVVAKDGQLLGTGAGQMSRLDSVRIACSKAGDRARGAVLASDAFFPFRDGPDVAAAAGITAIIQPGGSKRDDETFTACREHGMAMILTGRRHFRH
ncbi:bifunctional phosphoribosylaminoimidazolecarboxamide formyltransferase/IMP cyclohydrolase [bacterium]|nr:bifunctional phosphoribosylaminoimidazolecarboxamide formyltransferase/IMP cyclohydrolase [bacterium]